MAHDPIYHSLVEALQKPGCAICRITKHKVHGYLDALLYENVNDSGTRVMLRGAHGFCRVHTWLFQQIAAPQGINLGYAPLVETAAAELRLLIGRPPHESAAGVDLAILPMGIVEFDPLTAGRRISAQHPLLKEEATFDQTLEIVRQLQADRVILSHIEEPDGLSYDDLQALQQRLQGAGLPISFAYDTMTVDV